MIYDLAKLTELQPVKDKLKSFNLALRKLEAKQIHLAGLRDTNTGNKPMLDAILKKKIALNQEYNTLMDAKIDYVKKSVRPENQIYALVNQRLLESGLEVYTANKPEKIERILFEHGFQRYTTGNLLPATDYASGFKDDVNEMGAVGRYFSVGSPGYLDSSKLAIKCRTNSPQMGAAIMSITELRAKGFSADAIDKGYKRIQSDFPFLQNDGLPPKDSEIVYLRPEGHLDFTDEISMGSAPDSITWRGTVKEYYEDILMSSDPVPTSVHPSWKSMPTPPLVTVPVQTPLTGVTKQSVTVKS